MIDVTNIRSLSDFQRNTRSHITRLKRTGQPEVLTVNGQAELIVQDAHSYQQLLRDLEEAQAVAGVRRGLESMKRGGGRPMRAAIERLAAKHRISLKTKLK